MKNLFVNNDISNYEKSRQTKMKIKLIILIISIIIFSSIIDLSAEQVTPDAYFNSIRHEYVLNEDGSIEHNYEHSLKLLSYMSFNRKFGESFITYNPDWQELTITKSETKTSNGSITKSPFNAFNKVLPGHVGQAVPYMNLREMVVTHTGLERNCEVNFAYTLASKKGYYPGLIGKIIIGSHEPVKYFEIVIKVPRDTKINMHMSNSGPMGEKSTKGNYDFYIWKLKNLPLIPVESNQPAMELFMPTLYFSTATNSEIVGHFSIDNDKTSKLTKKAEEFCMGITKNKFSFQDKCFALRDYVFQNIAQTNINLSELGWKTLDAQTTFDKNVGSKLDRAVLLTAMLRVVGINAELAITSEYTNAKPDISLLSQCGEYLVYCSPDDDKDLPLLLDPNNNQTSILPKSVIRKPTFVLSAKKVSLIPATEDNGTLSFSANLKIPDSGESIEGYGKVVLTGDYIPDIDFEKTSKSLENIFTASEWTVEDKTKVLISGNDFEKDFALKKNLDRKYDEIIEFELPMVSEKSKRIGIIPVSRITPFSINSIIDEDYTINLELAEGMKTLLKPEKIEITNPVGSVFSQIIEDGKNIKIQRRLKINRIIIAPEDYHHLYALISAWRNSKHNKLYFK